MTYPAGMDIKVAIAPEQSGILASGTLACIAGLVREFETVRLSLLERRVRRQAELDAGKLPVFSPRLPACATATGPSPPCLPNCRTGASGKTYQLNAKTAVLCVRPRGWHMVEKRVTVDGKPVSASRFDFGRYFFHNAQALLSRGTIKAAVLMPEFLANYCYAEME